MLYPFGWHSLRMYLRVSNSSPHWRQCVLPAPPMQFHFEQACVDAVVLSAKIRASVVLLSWPFSNQRFDKSSWRAAWHCNSLMNFPRCCLKQLLRWAVPAELSEGHEWPTSGSEKGCLETPHHFQRLGGFGLLQEANWNSSFPPTAVGACTPLPWLDLRWSRGRLLSSLPPAPGSAGNS